MAHVRVSTHMCGSFAEAVDKVGKMYIKVALLDPNSMVNMYTGVLVAGMVLFALASHVVLAKAATRKVVGKSVGKVVRSKME